MGRFAEMIELMNALWGHPDTWPKDPRKSQAGRISKKRAAVYHKVRKAILSGRLIQQPCNQCGSSKNINAHHHDYTRALEVEWLCASCHIARHKREQRTAARAKLAA